MPISFPCSELKISTDFLHLLEDLMTFFYWAHSVLISMECPHWNIFNQIGIYEIFCSLQARSCRGSRGREIDRINLDKNKCSMTAHGMPKNVYPIHINSWQSSNNAFDFL